MGSWCERNTSFCAINNTRFLFHDEHRTRGGRLPPPPRPKQKPKSARARDTRTRATRGKRRLSRRELGGRYPPTPAPRPRHHYRALPAKSPEHQRADHASSKLGLTTSVDRGDRVASDPRGGRDHSSLGVPHPTAGPIATLDPPSLDLRRENPVRSSSCFRSFVVVVTDDNRFLCRLCVLPLPGSGKGLRTDGRTPPRSPLVAGDSR